MAMTADPRIARLRRLDAEATPGPWTLNSGGYVRTPGGAFNEHDGALIAAMRNAWPAMVTLVEGVLDQHTMVLAKVYYGGLVSAAASGVCAFEGDLWPCPDVLAALAVLDTLDPP